MSNILLLRWVPGKPTPFLWLEVRMWCFKLFKGCLLPPTHPIDALGFQAGLLELFPSAGPGEVSKANVMMGRVLLQESTVQRGQGLYGLSQVVSVADSRFVTSGGAQK